MTLALSVRMGGRSVSIVVMGGSGDSWSALLGPEGRDPRGGGRAGMVARLSSEEGVASGPEGPRGIAGTTPRVGAAEAACLGVRDGLGLLPYPRTNSQQT
jgi:hypothetical protein